MLCGAVSFRPCPTHEPRLCFSFIIPYVYKVIVIVCFEAKFLHSFKVNTCLVLTGVIWKLLEKMNKLKSRELRTVLCF